MASQAMSLSRRGLSTAAASTSGLANTIRPLRCGAGRRTLVTKAILNPRGDKDVSDRVLACSAYLLPLLDAFPYGKFIMFQYPFMARALAPLGPLYALYTAFPFAPFLIFLAIYSGIVNNQSLSRYVRYNAMQAVLLDILLIIPSVIMNDVFHPPSDPLGMQAYMSGYNTIFLFMAICSLYGMGSCLVGVTPRLPLVAEAADSQVRDGPSGW